MDAGNEFTPIQSSSNNLLRDIRFESTNQTPSGFKPFSKLAQQMEEMEAVICSYKFFLFLLRYGPRRYNTGR